VRIKIIVFIIAWEKIGVKEREKGLPKVCGISGDSRGKTAQPSGSSRGARTQFAQKKRTAPKTLKNGFRGETRGEVCNSCQRAKRGLLPKVCGISGGSRSKTAQPSGGSRGKTAQPPGSSRGKRTQSARSCIRSTLWGGMTSVYAPSVRRGVMVCSVKKEGGTTVSAVYMLARSRPPISGTDTGMG